jgi:hypothetical protein
MSRTTNLSARRFARDNYGKPHAQHLYNYHHIHYFHNYNLAYVPTSLVAAFYNVCVAGSSEIPLLGTFFFATSSHALEQRLATHILQLMLHYSCNQTT